MKNTSILLGVVGLASQFALAQVQTAPGMETPSVGDAEAPAASQPSGTTPAPGMESPDTSGATGTSGASGAQDTSGATGTTPDTSTPSQASPAQPMQSEAGAEQFADAPPLAERLTPKTQGDVTYLCGGVGEEEVAAMKQARKDYDLMLTFATRSGDYLADVDVDIRDRKGNQVLQAACGGPIMLVDLPRSGSYKVRAEAAGYTLNQTVQVTDAKRKGQRVATATVLNWPQRVASAPAEAETTSGASGAGGAAGTTGAGSTESTTGTTGSGAR